MGALFLRLINNRLDDSSRFYLYGWLEIKLLGYTLGKCNHEQHLTVSQFQDYLREPDPNPDDGKDQLFPKIKFSGAQHGRKRALFPSAYIGVTAVVLSRSRLYLIDSKTSPPRLYQMCASSKSCFLKVIKKKRKTD